MTPYPGVPTPTVSVFPGDRVSAILGREFAKTGADIDIVPESKRGLGNDAAGYPVAALLGGTVIRGQDSGITYTGPHQVIIKDDSGFTIHYNHVDSGKQLWQRVNPGEVIGFVSRWEDDIDNMILDENGQGMAHLDLRLKVSGQNVDPTFLITNWGLPVKFGD